MRQFEAMALRAVNQSGYGQSKVTTPLPLPRLGIFSLRQCHLGFILLSGSRPISTSVGQGPTDIDRDLG